MWVGRRAFVGISFHLGLELLEGVVGEGVNQSC